MAVELNLWVFDLDQVGCPLRAHHIKDPGPGQHRELTAACCKLFINADPIRMCSTPRDWFPAVPVHCYDGRAFDRMI